MAELFDILTFDSDEAENVPITTTEPDWTDVLTLTTTQREAGKYLLLFSLQFHHASTSQSFFYRFSLDGGSSWGVEYEKEVKDRHNIEVVEVSSVMNMTLPGIIDLRVQCTKEGGAVCEVLKAFISAQRVG